MDIPFRDVDMRDEKKQVDLKAAPTCHVWLEHLGFFMSHTADDQAAGYSLQSMATDLRRGSLRRHAVNMLPCGEMDELFRYWVYLLIW